MVIREMDLSDVERVRAIALATWRNTYSGFIPEEIQDKVLKDAYSIEAMNNRFSSSLNLVAENGEEIMGYAFFSGNLSDKDVFLESLYIHPNHQGKGLGKLLLLTGLEQFKEPATLSLTVYKVNPNISFYEREGFEVMKENKGEFYGHPVVFTLMKRNLDNLVK
ncbi:GNAT family N-acetyltransferase [Sporosarcina luteola]|uniref:GNAT family N-acetyltransferase n=1 Tax=Sporosarcina luteola TaxID=582850 RepID=UPI00203BF58B|nr:GNAT family N-acetyltransferase [Sporosarcina luteola]MCM3711758.1 GNAT family N-acetyltransferase [Sporosarcina luteola]